MNRTALEKIANALDAIRADICHLMRSDEPPPKFKAGDKVRVVRDTKSTVASHYIGAGWKGRVETSEGVNITPLGQSEIVWDCHPENVWGHWVWNSDLELIPDEPAKPAWDIKAAVDEMIPSASKAAEAERRPEGVLLQSEDGKTGCTVKLADLPKPTIDPAGMPERKPKIVLVTKIFGKLFWHYRWGSNCKIHDGLRSIPIGWTFDTTDDGEVVLRHTCGQTMTAEDVYKMTEWEVRP